MSHQSPGEEKWRRDLFGPAQPQPDTRRKQEQKPCELRQPETRALHARKSTFDRQRGRVPEAGSGDGMAAEAGRHAICVRHVTVITSQEWSTKGNGD